MDASATISIELATAASEAVSPLKENLSVESSPKKSNPPVEKQDVICQI
jgi:hypothetical protein